MSTSLINFGSSSITSNADVLWTNSSPSSAFSNVSWQSDDNFNNYWATIVEYKAYRTDEETLFSPIFENGGAGFLPFTSRSSTNYGGRPYRWNRWGFSFGDARNHSTSANNNYAVPIRIYGLKHFLALNSSDRFILLPSNTLRGSGGSFLATKQSSGSSIYNLYDAYDEIGLGCGWYMRTDAAAKSTAYLYSEYAIDMTNYSTLYMNLYSYSWGNSSQGTTIGLFAEGNVPTQANDYMGSNFSYKKVVKTGGKHTFNGIATLDISSITGRYHIGVCVAGSGADNYRGYCMLRSAMLG